MFRAVRGCLIVVALAAAAPSTLPAQILTDPCCHACLQPQHVCHCTTTRPVVRTELRAQQVVRYRDIAETHLRQEAYVEQVPVTRLEQVTVDEGGYQMVWVPKPVTRQVARTEIHQQVKSVAVPYQVTRRVAETTTQLVPHQTVQYITETRPMVASFAPVAVAAPCLTCDPLTGLTSLSFQPAPYALVPATAGATATMPTITVPMTAQAPPATLLAPEPVSSSYDSAPVSPVSDGWKTIETRRRSESSAPAPGGYQLLPPTTSTDAQKSLFTPAPSAAAVWQARRSTLQR